MCRCGGLFSSGHEYSEYFGQLKERRGAHRFQQSSSKQFIDKNGKGGYTFYFDDSVPTKAKSSFKRAVRNWVQLTGVNWTVSDISGDALITFKKLSGPLGMAYTQWVNYGAEESWITNLKIEFNDSTNWYYGENPNYISFLEYDFETVALHELGHCFQLEHDKNPNELMYASTRNGETKRKITTNALNAALDMKNSSSKSGGLNYKPMKWLDVNSESKREDAVPIKIVHKENELTVLNLTNDVIRWYLYQYSTTGPDAHFFRINQIDGSLSFINKPDYEDPLDQNTDNIYEISIIAQSWFSQEIDNFEIHVQDVEENTPPIFTNQSTYLNPLKFSVNENSKDVGHVLAEDNENDLLYYSIQGGEDSSLFTIHKHDGLIMFKAPPSFSDPLDRDRNNQYNLLINVSDGLMEDKLWVKVSVKKQQSGSVTNLDQTLDKRLGNWRIDSWMGIYFQHGNGWIYHLELGWCYLVKSKNNWIWLWQDKLGWVTTGKDVFPHVFLLNENQWRFLKYRDNKVYLYSYKRNSWEKMNL